MGNGVVLIGMRERSSRQAITAAARKLFAAGAAEKVIVAGMPKLCSAMQLDTVFTFADRDLVTVYPKTVGAELGRGGSHCMTCPIIRDPLADWDSVPAPLV